MPTAQLVSDADLVQRMARGEDAALAGLYDRWASLVLATAMRLTRDQSDAEEIVVEAFAQAWKSADRFDASRGSVPAWLSTMARSRALDLVRARGRRSRLEEASVATVGAPRSTGEGPSAPDAPVLTRERQRAVAEALGALPDPQRQAIELAYFGGLSQSEIATQLGEPLGTIKTRVRLAMAKLRDTLRPYYHAEPAQ
ncbi:MAG: sigma-70 family RNA polymerase sigma factor [Gemmatimonadota bacterium]|nr:sigma-70 family RNA polymerase sigma factor [Gemmatimonadota bacterium]